MAKLGTGSLDAWMRQGLREIRGALYPASNVAQPTEQGMYGTKTPGEVAEGRRDEPQPPLDLEQEQPARESILNDRLQQAADRQSQHRDQKDLSLDR